MLSSCIGETRIQPVEDHGQASHCSASTFVAPKEKISANDIRRMWVLPREIAEIKRGVYAYFTGGHIVLETSWVGIDFDRKLAIQVDQISGVAYGPSVEGVSQTETDYYRETPKWIEIVHIQSLVGEELDALACLAQDLWHNERNDRDTSISDIWSALALVDDGSEKGFSGRGRTGGDAGTYANALQRRFPRVATTDMERVRGAIIHDTAYGFTRDAGDRVFFESGDDSLTVATQARLDRWAFYLTKRPSLRMLLEGHADDRGSTKLNLALARRRANAVRDYLSKHGVDRTRIEVLSFGKERPAVLGTSDTARAQNRRVVGLLEQLLPY